MATNVLVNYQGANDQEIQVSAANPLPIDIQGGTAAADGSGTIATGGTAQNLFSGATPKNGFAVYNPDASNTLWISWSTTAAANGEGSIPILPDGGYESPANTKPYQAISIVGASTGQKFTALSW